MSAESTAVAILNSTAGVAAKLRMPCFLAMFALTLSSICADAAEFYVAPDGKDTNAGTKGAPFATLTRARDAVRSLKQAKGLPDRGVTVWIRGGVYRFDTTMQLGPEDSGTKDAPIVYRAGEGENVIFDGSRPIDAPAFYKVEDAATLARLCPVARGKVLRAVIEDASTVKALSSSGALQSVARRQDLRPDRPSFRRGIAGDGETAMNRLCYAFLALAFWTGVPLAQEASADGPNILFCLADDQSYPHASAYGEPVISTPVFDRVAREGVLFTQAYCAAPSCTPSRRTM